MHACSNNKYTNTYVCVYMGETRVQPPRYRAAYCRHADARCCECTRKPAFFTYIIVYLFK